jgi:hypothetical protein
VTLGRSPETTPNGGNEPELNIFFSYKAPNDNIWKIPLVELYSLAPGEKFYLEKNIYANEIGLSYSDIQNRLISSSAKDHETQFDTDIFCSIDKTNYQSLLKFISDEKRL